MEDIFKGVIGSLIAAAIVWLITRLGFGWKSWPGTIRLFRITREFTKSGGLNFFSSRQSYLKFKDHGTASKYVSQAESSLIYVGFWLAHGVEVGNLLNEIKSMLDKGRKVTIVLMDPHSDVIEFCSRFLGFDPDEIKSRILSTYKKFCELYTHLSTDGKRNFILKLHSIPLSASAFLIDNDTSEGKTLVDFKIYNYCRDDGFGMEFHKKGNSLYDKFTNSYCVIANEAVKVNCNDNLG